MVDIGELVIESRQGGNAYPLLYNVCVFSGPSVVGPVPPSTALSAAAAAALAFTAVQLLQSKPPKPAGTGVPSPSLAVLMSSNVMTALHSGDTGSGVSVFTGPPDRYATHASCILQGYDKHRH